MKVLVVGGGPAGLFFALLMKKLRPESAVTVMERNPRGNTFGWGVVFSGRTLEFLAGPDPETHKAILDRVETWSNVDIVHRGELVSVGGNRFSGIARITLLEILQERCESVGVDLRYEVEVEDPADLPEHDLLIAADGVRSRLRDADAESFGPDLRTERNPYVWYGTPRLFHGLTLTFRENDAGLFIAHSYKFSPSLSTFIVECDPDTWRRAGLDTMDEASSRAYLEGVFADDLQGEPLLSNNSAWIRFVTVRNRSWVSGRTVLLGDAAHTAHFSIGSGTKLAMEDSAALAASFATWGDDLVAALGSYQQARRPAVEKLQAAARSSLAWFENAAADLHLAPVPFALRAMTRSDRIDVEGLRRRDPEFVRAVEEQAPELLRR